MDLVTRRFKIDARGMDFDARRVKIYVRGMDFEAMGWVW